MRKRIEQLSFCALVALAMSLFWACETKDYYQPNEEPDAEQPSLHTFSTVEDVTLNMQYDVPAGYAAAFNLYTEIPFTTDNGHIVLRNDIKSIGSGIAISGKYEMAKTLPAYATDLYAYSDDLFAPTLMHAKVTGATATFAPVVISDVLGQNQSTRSIQDGTVDHYLGQYGNRADVDNNHKPNYIAYHQNIPSETLSAIASAFPERIRADEKYYTDASMYLQQNTKVWISVIGDGAYFYNSLSYFCFTGTKEELAAYASATKPDVKEVIAIPAVKLGLANGLQIGDYVQLKYFNGTEYVEEFPAGTTIGWVLRSQGYNTSSKQVDGSPYSYGAGTGPYGVFYSVVQWNVEGNTALRNHTMQFNAGTTEDPFICFGFEDEYNDNEKSDRDCNDVLFHVVTDPKDAINPPPLIVEDPKDVVTHDNSFGIVAFEDYWPCKGDYDLNDVIVKYESDVTLLQKANSTQVYATEINDVFSLIHTGADYNNQFAYRINLHPNNVESITIDDAKSTYTADGDGIIIDLCPNVRAEIAPYVEVASPKKYKVTIKLKDGSISQEAAAQITAPYNPFISPKAGVEVHLPFYKPTSRASLTYFGTEDDRSNPDNNIYYVAGQGNNYPFAIHLSGVDKFTVPTETQSIDITYPAYNKWVESGFQNNKDWYLNPVLK
ncbi:LruC domain-containing protein [Bacteroides sp. OttesenSCG-928-J23]|nr:LruC domain-containing protein [Bacteroides sp. OttesenSCG-928-J23]MDL2304363.1 LruC domain-containing protein [Bacteroides sp. OttesenSCG-928-D19]